MQSGMWVNAGTLFGVAKTAYERTKSAGKDREGGQMDALVSVLFAAASLEAFINEAAAMATLWWSLPGKTSYPPSVSAFAAIIEEVERSHGSINLKYLLTRVVFAGEAYDRGVQPYQDFAILVQLRNDLVHLKREEFQSNSKGDTEDEIPRILRGLQAKNVLAEFGPGVQASWTLWITTSAVARWACNTAADMVRSVLEIVPDSGFKDSLDQFYSSTFTPVQ